jgi:hypothetical protein
VHTSTQEITAENELKKIFSVNEIKLLNYFMKFKPDHKVQAEYFLNDSKVFLGSIEGIEYLPLK